MVIFQIQSYSKEEYQTTKYFVSVLGRQKYLLTAFGREVPLRLFSLFSTEVQLLRSLPQPPGKAPSHTALRGYGNWGQVCDPRSWSAATPRSSTAPPPGSDTPSASRGSPNPESTNPS